MKFIWLDESKKSHNFIEKISLENMLIPKHSELLNTPVVELSIMVHELDVKETVLLLKHLESPPTKHNLAQRAAAKYNQSKKKLHGCETGDCTDCGGCE
jgi:hypothetical protein